MTKPVTTKDRLLTEARRLFWTRGYSNVSVRDVTGAAGVDAALVSRYFGGKRGLFDATLVDLGPWDALAASGEDFLPAMVSSFSQPFDPETEQVNPFTLLIANANDPEIGGAIRELVRTSLAAPLAAKLDGDQPEQRAAMLLAALFGMALMRKGFQLEALADQPLDALSSQTLHLASAAMNYRRD